MGKNRKYNKKHFEQVVSLVNDSKMKKGRAIIEAGFRSRQSYYTALHALELEEVLTIREFEFKASKENKRPIKKVSFI